MPNPIELLDEISLNERIIKTNSMEHIYNQILYLCQTTDIKPIVFFDIDDTVCIYSNDIHIKTQHKLYVTKILDLLEEENVYFITNRHKHLNNDSQQNTIDLLIESICHPFIHQKTKIIFCRFYKLVDIMMFQDVEVPKYTKILEFQEKFNPKTWVYFIDDLNKHVEWVYHALKYHHINFTCFLFDDQNVEKKKYVDIYQRDKMIYNPPNEFLNDC